MEQDDLRKYELNFEFKVHELHCAIIDLERHIGTYGAKSGRSSLHQMVLARDRLESLVGSIAMKDFDESVSK